MYNQVDHHDRCTGWLMSSWQWLIPSPYVGGHISKGSTWDGYWCQKCVPIELCWQHVSPTPNENEKRIVLGANSLVQFADVIKHMLECSVVHQNIDSTHALKSRVDNLLTILLLPNVDCQGVTITPSLLNPSLGFLRVLFLLWKIDDQAWRALHGK